MKTKLEAARRALAEACEKRDAAYKALEDAPDETSAEDLTALTTTFDEAQAEVERQNDRVGGVERIMRAREATPTLVPVPTESEDEGDGGDGALRFAAAKGGKEERTYTPQQPYSFFNDIVHMKSSPEAAERLRRHSAETRDLSTTATAGGGFVPPLYMGELFADIPRPGRDFADILPSRQLPTSGMSITIPRITTGPAVAVTTAENASVNEVDMVEATITVPVRTIAGQQDVSQQLLDRSDPSIDSVIFGDLRSSYDMQLDTQLLAGTGSSGQALGIRAVTSVNTVSYTDASPTAAELLPKIYDAAQKVYNNRYAPPDTIVLHPRRSAWLASNLSSTFPLFQQGGLYQAAGTQDNALLTSFAGMRVVHDANIATNYGASTNEDEIYVLRAADLILWESPIQARVLPEVLSGTLTVRLQLFGYAAFASARFPAAITVISGTGLVTPTF